MIFDHLRPERQSKFSMNENHALKQLFTELFAEEAAGALRRMIFSDRRKKNIEFQKVTLRPILSGDRSDTRLCFQAEYTFPKKVTHRNLAPEEAADFCLQLCVDSFKQIQIFTASQQIQVLASKPEHPAIRRKPIPTALQKPNPSGSQRSDAAGRPKTAAGSLQSPASPEERALCRSTPQQPGALPDLPAPSLSHNRQKHYLIPDGVPCDFLIRLGVMSPEGRVFPKSYAKFRQINRYLEIVEDVFPALPTDRTLRIIDFGCGKAYLTFAIYYYLKILKGRDVEIIGLDLKEDVIDFCNQVASDLGYRELQFLKGDIADYTSDHADMVVTLHACDTATDYALIHAVRWNTRVILSVPCCQHELFRQIQNDLHRPMLKHGILKDRLTEYLTDGLRGLKLEACGYQVAMIEFTSLEHTARNIMIKAVKSNAVGAAAAAKKEAAQHQYEALRDFYHVHPTIDQLEEPTAD